MNTLIPKSCLSALACKLLAATILTSLISLAASEVCAQNRPAYVRRSGQAKSDVPLFMKSLENKAAEDTHRANQEILRVAAESLTHYELMKGSFRQQDELPLQSGEEKPKADAVEQIKQAESQKKDDEQSVEWVKKVGLKPLDGISLDIREKAEKRPPDLSIDLVGQPIEYQSQSDWTPRLFLWEPANLFYNPLYFQDVPLERYGQKLPPLRQSILSGAHFFGDAIMFPFRAAVVRPWTCVSPLGYEQSGNCVPFTYEKLLHKCR